ncbi:MAG: hypothetical protein AAGI66_10160 [Cyanobacteria bacterium P01_H01_bin.74]
MPTYTYQCSQCNQLMSHQASISAHFVSPVCTLCGGITHKAFVKMPTVLMKPEVVQAAHAPTKNDHNANYHKEKHRDCCALHHVDSLHHTE